MKKNNKQEARYESFEQEEILSSTEPKQKKRKKPILWILDFAIVGLLVTGIYFLVKPYYVAYQQDKVMKEISNLIRDHETVGSDIVNTQIPDDELDSNATVDLDSIPKTEETLPGIWVDSKANAVEGEQIERFTVDGAGYERSVVNADEYELPDEIYLQPMGQIQIDSIGLDIPLLVGAKVVPLRYGAGWYESSADIGSQGRATILGHAFTYSRRFFTDLPKVEVGNSIRIVQNGRTLYYKVYDKKFVPAEELGGYLQNNEVDSELMLVSCYPRPTWEQRVLVFARLVDVRAH